MLLCLGYVYLYQMYYTFFFRKNQELTAYQALLQGNFIILYDIF